MRTSLPTITPPRIHAEHRLAGEGNFPGKYMPPTWVLDKIAEQSLSGGYSKRRNPMCPKCMIMRSTSGSCMC